MDIKWKDGGLEAAQVTSDAGGDCRLQVGDRIVPVSLRPGDVYVMDASPGHDEKQRRAGDAGMPARQTTNES